MPVNARVAAIATLTRFTSIEPPRIGPTSTENPSHPTTSLIIAVAITRSPTSVLKRPRSRSVFAMTGSAEIESATPRNAAKMPR